VNTSIYIVAMITKVYRITDVADLIKMGNYYIYFFNLTRKF